MYMKRKLCLFIILACAMVVPAYSADYDWHYSASVTAQTAIFASAYHSQGGLLSDGSNILQADFSAHRAVAGNFRVGAGLGYRFYRGRSSEELLSRTASQSRGSVASWFRQQSLPLFLSAELSSQTARVSPLVTVRAGYNLPTDWNGAWVYRGLFTDGTFGVSVRARSVRFHAGLSLLFDNLHNTDTGNNSFLPHAGLRIGMTF